MPIALGNVEYESNAESEGNVVDISSIQQELADKVTEINTKAEEAVDSPTEHESMAFAWTEGKTFDKYMDENITFQQYLSELSVVQDLAADEILDGSTKTLAELKKEIALNVSSQIKFELTSTAETTIAKKSYDLGMSLLTSNGGDYDAIPDENVKIQISRYLVAARVHGSREARQYLVDHPEVENDCGCDDIDDPDNDEPCTDCNDTPIDLIDNCDCVDPNGNNNKISYEVINTDYTQDSDVDLVDHYRDANRDVNKAVQGILNFCSDEFSRSDVRGIDWKNLATILPEILVNHPGGMTRRDFRQEYIQTDKYERSGLDILQWREVGKIVDLINAAAGNDDVQVALKRIADLGAKDLITESYNMQEVVMDGITSADNVFTLFANFDFNEEINSLNDADGLFKKKAERDMGQSLAGMQMYDMLALHCDVDMANWPNHIEDGPKTSEAIQGLLEYAKTKTTNAQLQTELDAFLNTTDGTFQGRYNIKDAAGNFTMAGLLAFLQDPKCPHMDLVEHVIRGANFLNERSQASYIFENKAILADSGEMMTSESVRKICDTQVDDLQQQYFSDRMYVRQTMSDQLMSYANLITDTIVTSNSGVSTKDVMIGLLTGVAKGAFGGTWNLPVGQDSGKDLAETLAGYNSKQLKDMWGEFITTRIQPSIYGGLGPNGEPVAVLGLATDKLFGEGLREFGNRTGAAAQVAFTNPFVDGQPLSVNINLSADVARQTNLSSVKQLSAQKTPAVGRLGVEAGLPVHFGSDGFDWDAYVGVFKERDYAAGVEQQMNMGETYLTDTLGGVTQANLPTNQTSLETMLFQNAGNSEMVGMKEDGQENLGLGHDIVQQFGQECESFGVFDTSSSATERFQRYQMARDLFMIGYVAEIEHEGYTALGNGSLPKLTKLGVRVSLKDVIANIAAIGEGVSSGLKYGPKFATAVGKYLPGIGHVAGGLVGAVGGAAFGVLKGLRDFTTNTFQARFSTFVNSYVEDAKKTMSNYKQMNYGEGSFDAMFDTTDINTFAESMSDTLQVPALTVAGDATNDTLQLSGAGLASMNIRVTDAVLNAVPPLISFDGTTVTISPKIAPLNIYHQMNQDSRETYLVLGATGTAGTSKLDSAVNTGATVDGGLDGLAGTPQPLDAARCKTLVDNIAGTDATTVAALKLQLGTALFSDWPTGTTLISPLPAWAQNFAGSSFDDGTVVATETTPGSGTYTFARNTAPNDGMVHFEYDDPGSSGVPQTIDFYDGTEAEGLFSDSNEAFADIEDDLQEFELKPLYNITTSSAGGRSHYASFLNYSNTSGVSDATPYNINTAASSLSSMLGLYSGTGETAKVQGLLATGTVEQKKYLVDRFKSLTSVSRETRGKIDDEPFAVAPTKLATLSGTLSSTDYTALNNLITNGPTYSANGTYADQFNTIAWDTIFAAYPGNNDVQELFFLLQPVREIILGSSVRTRINNRLGATFQKLANAQGAVGSSLLTYGQQVANNIPSSATSYTMDKDPGLIGVNTYYRDSQANVFGMPRPGQIYYVKEAGFASITDATTKNWIVDSIQGENSSIDLNDNQSILATSINSKVNAQLGRDLTQDEITLLLKNTGVEQTLSDGKKITLNADFVAYAQGECCNPGYGVKIKGIIVPGSGSDYNSETEPGSKYVVNNGQYLADYDIHTDQRDMNLSHTRAGPKDIETPEDDDHIPDLNIDKQKTKNKQTRDAGFKFSF